MLDSNANWCYSLLDYANQLMKFFVKNCQAIRRETFAAYNVHGFLHLHKDLSFFQCSLNEISCFQFENFLQKLKRLIPSSSNQLVQVAKRLRKLLHLTQIIQSNSMRRKRGQNLLNIKIGSELENLILNSNYLLQT